MIDVVLLRVMRKRSDFFKLRGVIASSTVDKRTAAILDDYEKYFEKYPTHDDVHMDTFIPRFRQWHASLKEEVFNEYKNVLVNASKDADEDQRNNILSEMAELELMTTLANLADTHSAGELEDTFGSVTRAVDKYRTTCGLQAQSFVDIPIEELLQDEFDDSGVAWRLNCLNESMRKLRPGDFGIIAGRPDKGKTTFITSEVTYFAPQLPPDRNIIWLNNEGPGKRIKPRLYQSALGLSMTEMKEQSLAKTLVPAYREAIGGRLDKVRIFDIHGYNTGQVDHILDDHNPGIIIYDMIDGIRGFGDMARTDLMLEEMYRWARELSVKHECIGLATSQISNDGDGLQFPTLGMLKDSKTGKQGACDFQLMIGASNDVGLASSRFIGLPKNKLRRPDGPSDPRREVLFDGLRARYTDIPEGS